MYIAGDRRCQVWVEEPTALVVALYLRDVAGLRPSLPYELPMLDPPVTIWPAWTRRAPVGWTPPVPGRTRLVDAAQADAEWVRWWDHLLDADTDLDAFAFHPPQFRELRPVPAIRLLLQRHYDDASRWAEAIIDDPRVARQHDAPRAGLFAQVRALESDPDRIPREFRLRLTVIPVAAKHAWQRSDDHILISRRLISDTDNALDWLSPRISALAWQPGHITL